MWIKRKSCSCSRREFLRAGMYGLGVSAGLPVVLSQMSASAADKSLAGDEETYPHRILVVLELNGGNDGLNTVVPYGDDAYYRARPDLGIRRGELLKLDDYFALPSACSGFERLFKDGDMAIVHGCGYPEPSLSHFTATEWWHTATPHGSDEHGWLGRFADQNRPDAPDNYMVNIASKQSRAVVSDSHSAVVFKDPREFGREGSEAQQRVFETFGRVYPTSSASPDFVKSVPRPATTGAAAVRNACLEYQTLVEYGSDNDLTLDLKKVAAMIAADLPTRVYYVSMGGFDTHAAQAGSHNLLLIYLADAVRGFIEDVGRIGRGNDVAMMIFTEFGRRLDENASKGTDHGTATPIYIVGRPARGGFYGSQPSLTELDNGNLQMTTDFRSVYATMLKEWMGFGDTAALLKGDYPALGVFS